MSLVQVQYRAWTARRGRRAGATPVTIEDKVVVATVANPSLFLATAPPSVPMPAVTGMPTQMANFLFWSVTGTTADIAGTFQGNRDLQVNVRADDVTAVAWYLPVGSGGGTGTGWAIDAFDLDAGDFVLDDFVDVTSDPSLTAVANQEGFVPTAKAQTVVARGAISVGNFQCWDLLTQLQTTPTLDLEKNSAGLAFALYQRPRRGKVRPIHETFYGASRDIALDLGGWTPHGPVDPWVPYLAALRGAVDTAARARAMERELRKPVIESAATQVMRSAEQIVGALKKLE